MSQIALQLFFADSKKLEKTTEQVWNRCVVSSIYYKKDPVCTKLRANGIPHVLLFRSLCNYFSQTLKIREDDRTRLESLRCFLDLLQKGSRLHETSCKWDPTCSPLQIALQLFFADSKNKRRRQNTFGVAALFPRFTTKRIPFARNFVQMGFHMFSSSDRFATIFRRL